MENELVELGLGENEAKIYLTALSMREFAAGAIAQRAKIKRSTTYLALGNLIKLGLVSEILSKKRKLFRVEGPESLQNLVKRMHRKAIEAENIVEKLAPALSNIRVENATAPKTTFYNGMEGLKNVLLDVAASKSSWYVFGSTTKILKNLPLKDLREILEEGEINRQKSGRPKIYFITDKGIQALKEFQEHRPERREIKIVPDEIPVSSAQILYDNKIAMLSLGSNPFVSVVESKELFEVAKFMYHLVWNGLK